VPRFEALDEVACYLGHRFDIEVASTAGCPRAGTWPNLNFRTTMAATMHSTTDTLSTLNGVSDGLDVRSQGRSSLCTEAACDISLQVGRSEGVTPGSTINKVHVISLRGGWHKARKICGQLSMRSKKACASSLSLFQACVYDVSEFR
jgi:hypothetical protein